MSMIRRPDHRRPATGNVIIHGGGLEMYRRPADGYNKGGGAKSKPDRHQQGTAWRLYPVDELFNPTVDIIPGDFGLRKRLGYNILFSGDCKYKHGYADAASIPPFLEKLASKIYTHTIPSRTLKERKSPLDFQPDDSSTGSVTILPYEDGRARFRP